jgi:hypothetical protein
MQEEYLVSHNYCNAWETEKCGHPFWMGMDGVFDFKKNRIERLAKSNPKLVNPKSAHPTFESRSICNLEVV